MPKPFGEDRPRQTGLPRQLGNRPRMRMLMVKKGQGPPHVHITCTREPSGLTFRQVAQITPQRLGKEHFGQLRQHRAGSRLTIRRLGDGERQRVFQPHAGGIVADVDLDERWQPGEKGLTELRIAGQEAADEPGGLAATAKVQRFQAPFECARQGAGGVDRSHPSSAAEHVSMAMRERDEIAGRQCDMFTVLQLEVGPALAQQMVDDHVLRPLGEHRRERARLWRREAPGLGKRRIEIDRGVEPDDPKDFRERIHRRRSLAFGARRQEIQDAASSQLEAAADRSSKPEPRAIPILPAYPIIGASGTALWQESPAQTEEKRS